MSVDSNGVTQAAPPQTVGKARACLATAALALVLCCPPVLLVCLFLTNWYAYAALPNPGTAPGGRVIRVLIFVLLLALAGLALDWPRRTWASRGRIPRRAIGPVLSCAVLAVVVLQLDGLARFWPVRPTGWLAAFCALGLVVGWLLLALIPPWRASSRGRLGDPATRPWREAGTTGWVAGCLALALLAAAGTATGLRASAITVQGTTAAALPTLDQAVPSDPTGVSWQDPLGGDQEALAVAGRYVLVEQRDGVKVLDAATGAMRWDYLRRSDEYFLDYSMTSGDGQTVYAVFGSLGLRDPTVTVVALDAATGATRSQWTARDVADHDDGSSDTAADTNGGAWQVVGDELVHETGPSFSVENYQDVGVQATGYNARTGAKIWQDLWEGPTPADELTGPWCAAAASQPPNNTSASADGVLAVIAACAQNPKATIVQGVSQSTGKIIWTQDISSNQQPSVISVPGIGFLIENTETNTSILLDATSGRRLTSFDGVAFDPTSLDEEQLASDPENFLSPGQWLTFSPTSGALAVTNYDPKSWRATGTTTITLPTPAENQQVLQTQCSGTTYLTAYNNGTLTLLARPDAAGTHTRTTTEPGSYGQPEQLYCAPGELLLEAGPNTGAEGDVLYALG